MDFESSIKKQIISNVIKDKCKNCDYVIFDESLCTQDRVIRFATAYSLAEGTEKYYQIENNVESIMIRYLQENWLIEDSGDSNKLFDEFDVFLTETLPAFEKSQKEVSQFLEGSEERVLLTKYERNRKAREACLKANGTSCKVCGINFENEYGPEFAGIIEVHHIVPISEIGKEYVIDPIHDLVPVCPNCHTALHSKSDGVYSIEELILIRSRNQK